MSVVCTRVVHHRGNQQVNQVVNLLVFRPACQVQSHLASLLQVHLVNHLASLLINQVGNLLVTQLDSPAVNHQIDRVVIHLGNPQVSQFTQAHFHLGSRVESLQVNRVFSHPPNQADNRRVSHRDILQVNQVVIHLDCRRNGPVFMHQ